LTTRFGDLDLWATRPGDELRPIAQGRSRSTFGIAVRVASMDDLMAMAPPAPEGSGRAEIWGRLEEIDRQSGS
jgi:hypothetical protein